jgi:hypothetical protein
MPQKQIKLTIIATKTHCQDNGRLCPVLNFQLEGCDAFRRDLAFDTTREAYLRLPECVAAEVSAAEERYLDILRRAAEKVAGA